jgi:hypothetical protein
MSWEDFDIFIGGDCDKNLIKKSVFVFNHINIYPSLLWEWIQGKNSKYYDMVRWLIENELLKIVMTKEELESDLGDEIYYGSNRELHELAYRNIPKLANPPKYPKGYEDSLVLSSKQDAQDPIMKDISLRAFRKRFEDEYWSTDTFRQVMDSPVLTPKQKEGFKQELEKIYQLQLSFFLKRLLDEHHFQNRNEVIFDQFCSSYSVYVNSSEREFYEYKLSGYRDYNALRTIRAAETILPLVNQKPIQDFSFKELLEIRKKGTWKGAMKTLSRIADEIPCSEEQVEYHTIAKEKIQDVLFDVMESERGSVLSDSIKAVCNMGLNFIPIVGPILSPIKDVSDPFVNYLKNQEGKKKLAYFLLDLR